MDGSEGNVDREDAESAAGAAGRFKEDAEKALGDIRNRGIGGFFSFDHMYFPRIAEYAFIVVVMFSLAGVAIGVIGGVAAVFTASVWTGLAMIVFSAVGGAIGIVCIRIGFEMTLLAFKIHEGIREMVEFSRKSGQPPSDLR